MGKKRAIAVRDYNFGDGVLVSLGRAMAARVTKDLEALADHGVTEETVAHLNELMEAFINAPSESEGRGAITVAVEEKKKARSQALRQARWLRTAANNVFGAGSQTYSRFGFQKMARVHGPAFELALKKMKRNGLKYQEALAGEGINAAFFTGFQSAIDAFVAALDNVDIADEARDNLIMERADKGNILFKEIKRLSDIGRDAFAEVSAEHKKHYTITNFVRKGRKAKGIRQRIARP